jgi:competence protein ComEC
VESGELKGAKLLKKEEGNFLSGFRSKVVEFYKSVLPQPESGALAGIVFGARGAMPSDFYNQTKTSGLFHLVIPSGLKTTLVISFLIGFFALFVRRQIAIPFVILTILIYLLITGFDAPIVRSAIMASVAFTAQIFGRVVSPWRVFFLTVFIMLIFQPDWVTDIGFYVSFASVAFLMLYEKDFAGYLKSLKFPKVLVEDFSASLIAQLGAAPILYLAFNQLSLLSPVANVLVLWMIPFLMALGMLGGILGLAFPEAGRLLLYASFPMLWIFSKVVQVFGG